MPYPTVIATSVVRSAHKGESHGGVFLIDLEAETFEQVVDWDTAEIEWAGRGHDRGLRGIAFWGGRTYIAASDSLMVYDRGFRLVGRHRNRYLRHCHEIDVEGDTLWLTSTGFDSLLAFDLKREAFIRGCCLRLGVPGLIRRRLAPSWPPRLRTFDPESPAGPAAGDSVHLNMVAARGGAIYCSGTRLACVMQLSGEDLRRYARIPLSTHNAMPHGEAILLQDTARDRVLTCDRDGKEIESWSLPTFEPESLLFRDLPSDHARQAFGRGLCTAPGGLIIAGSSPSTVSVFESGQRRPLRSVNLTLDVRSAIHGLELYPH